MWFCPPSQLVVVDVGRRKAESKRLSRVEVRVTAVNIRLHEIQCRDLLQCSSDEGTVVLTLSRCASGDNQGSEGKRLLPSC